MQRITDKDPVMDRTEESGTVMIRMSLIRHNDQNGNVPSTEMVHRVGEGSDLDDLPDTLQQRSALTPRVGDH